MSGEIKLFRREMFGGFARKDVIDYIRRLATERNKYLEENKTAKAEIEKLNATIEELRAELDASNLMIKQVRVAALGDAQRALSELDGAYGEVRSGIEETANQIRGELLRAADIVSLVTRSFEQAGKRIGELSGILDSEKAIADEQLREVTPPEPGVERNPEVVLEQLQILPRSPAPAEDATDDARDS